MLPGFPKSIKTTKIKRGHYVIEREDGYTAIVVRGVGRWLVNHTWASKTLATVKYDVANGFTARDQCNAADDLECAKHSAAHGQKAWETAMGMHGYAGSAAEREEREESRA